MTIKYELEAELRTDIGKGASRRLRRTDQVPAIIYGAKKDSALLKLDHNKVANALKHEAFYSRILTLKIGSLQEKVVLKDVQRNPARPRIQHIDFLRINENEKLEMHIPLHFLGDTVAPGVKAGGVVLRNMADIEVSCLPANLPEYVEVDLSKLELDQAIHLSDLKLPKGVELVAMMGHEVGGEHDLPVVAIHMPRQVVEETEAPVAPAEVPATQVSAEPPAAAETPAKK